MLMMQIKVAREDNLADSRKTASSKKYSSKVQLKVER